VGARDGLPIILGNLDLIAHGAPTNAAVLLFGRQPQRTLRHAVIRLAYFRSINDFTAYPDCTGTLFQQVEQALLAVEQANPGDFVFPSTHDWGTDPRRREVPQYALPALREAIVNALVHRDYYQSGGDIELKMFPDRLVVANPGGLLPGVTVASLRESPHLSARRNRRVAEVCFLNFVVERYGTGTTRMIEACRNAGLPEPEFVADEHNFAVTFRKDPLRREALVALGLTARQADAVMYVKAHGAVSRAQYRAATGAPERSAARDLAALVERGILRQEGQGRATRYVLASSP
jgi:ATP-dependent DNA helicase RecG